MITNASGVLRAINSFPVRETGNPFTVWGRGIDVTPDAFIHGFPAPLTSGVEMGPGCGVFSPRSRADVAEAAATGGTGPAGEPKSARGKLLFHVRAFLGSLNRNSSLPSHHPLHGWLRDGSIQAPNLLEHYQDVESFLASFEMGVFQCHKFVLLMAEAILEEIEEKKSSRTDVFQLVMAYAHLGLDLVGYQDWLDPLLPRYRAAMQLFDFRNEWFSRPIVVGVAEELMRGDPEARQSIFNALESRLSPKEIEFLRLRFEEGIVKKKAWMAKMKIAAAQAFYIETKAFRELDGLVARVIPALVQDPKMDINTALGAVVTPAKSFVLNDKILKANLRPFTATPRLGRVTAYPDSDFDMNLFVGSVVKFLSEKGETNLFDAVNFCTAARAALRYKVDPRNAGELEVVVLRVYGSAKLAAREKLSSFLDWLEAKGLMRESFDLGRVKRDKVGGEILSRLNGQPEVYRCDDELKRKPARKGESIDRRLLIEAVLEFLGPEEADAAALCRAAEIVFKYGIKPADEAEMAVTLRHSFGLNHGGAYDSDAKFIVRRLLKWLRAHGYSWERLKT